MTAPRLPGVKSRNRSSWPRIAATFASSVVAIEQVPLRRAARRVADHPGPAADERDRPPAEALEPEQPEDRHEVADVERSAGRVEADVAGDRAAGRQAGRAARASSRARIPRQSSSASRPAGLATAAWAVAVTGVARRVVSTEPGGRADRSFTPPMLSCGHRCRPPSRGASAIDGRSGAAARTDADRPLGRDRRRHPVILLLDQPASSPGPARSLAVGAYNHYAAGLPDPVAALNDIEFEQQTIIYDRTGKIELARLGDLKRELVDLRPAPARDARRDDRDRGQGLLDRTRASTRSASSRPASTRSPASPRGASTITQQLVRARLLPARGVRGLDLRAQDPRDHPVDPPDPGLSRARRASRQIITAYLNQNFYGNQSYGVKAAAKGYFGKALDRPDPRPVRDPRRDPAVADQVRPRCATPSEVCLDETSPRARNARSSSSSSRTTRRSSQRRNHVLDLMKTRSPLTGDKHTPAEYEAAKDEPVELTPAGLGRLEGAPLRVAGPRRARPRSLCPDTPDDCPEVDTGGFQVIDDARLEDAEDRREVGLRRRPGTERQGPAGDPDAAARSRAPTRSWILGPARPQHPQRGGRGHGLPDRRGPRLRRSARATRPRATRSSSPSSTSSSDGWRQPGSAIKPIDYAIGIEDKTLTASTMFMDVTTNFGGGFTPTQADKLERGPVRLRSALQFSLNIPAIKATIISGLDHVVRRGPRTSG